MEIDCDEATRLSERMEQLRCIDPEAGYEVFISASKENTLEDSPAVLEHVQRCEYCELKPKVTKYKANQVKLLLRPEGERK